MAAQVSSCNCIPIVSMNSFKLDAFCGAETVLAMRWCKCGYGLIIASTAVRI